MPVLLIGMACASDDSLDGSATAPVTTAPGNTVAIQPVAGMQANAAISDPVPPPSEAPAASSGDGLAPAGDPPAPGMPPQAMTGNPAPDVNTPEMPVDMPGDTAVMQPSTPRTGETCLEPGDGNYSESGPYQVGMMDIDLGMIQDGQNSGAFTVFYPMPLEESCPHPIVAWGNGTAVTGSGTYAFFNSNAAAWGMVVVASHEDNAGSGAFHIAALDWLLEQNADSSSIFYQKLSTRAGTSGHSQGGFGATAGANHPNVEAQVSVGAGGRGTEKVAVLILTGTEDILGDNPGGLVDRATGPAFVASWEGGDHFLTETVAGYIGRDPGTMQMQRFYAAWFRCFLADDSTACSMFEGGAPAGCGVCTEPGWDTLASKNL